ncbi:hypothetical protein [Marivita cryptomonadis]|uniref:Uncharacterized protein n=2 Tax=Roseobacteraceae TaxID=2854170 RepID=A0A9Q2P8A2_9RHOB|nr:hypothetical protein [Marivita cryptomonadis]MCR9168626.1 hypothetical protein [Paracoccaceae bacterium]MBM2330411.1 hypothetical protein [Marivita cryptomonadis]MBM2344658.1 hypothetical protein [Marivita cryptomonadis]MBM2349336.1 hypothetical protein [Marivita cryptomonadis]MBM2368519.1 hypothetical protein [Marivita cryptomonadis]
MKNHITEILSEEAYTMPKNTERPVHQIPDEMEKLNAGLKTIRGDVQVLHPLLDLLQDPDGSGPGGTAAVRLIKMITDMKIKQEAIEAEVADVKEAVLMIKEKSDTMAEILDRLDTVLNSEVD